MLITGNQRLIRHVNRMAILREIRNRPGISRTELAEVTGLTRAAIGRLVEGLTEDGWLAEDKKTVSGSLGRRPTPLVFDEYRRVLLGAQLDTERTRVVATTLKGEVFEMGAEQVEGLGAGAVLERLVQQLVAQHARLSAAGRIVCGVGVAVPGPVNPLTGVLRFSESTGWHELPVRESLEAGLAAAGYGGIPVIVDRGVNCLALQHVETNRVDLADTVLYFHVGSSVAVSAVLQGELLRGNQGLAGYVAHQQLDADGPPCSCGRKGCVHAMLTLEALSRNFGLAATAPSSLFSVIRDAVAVDDGKVRQVMQAFGNTLGCFVYNLCQTYDPARVFLGGAAFQLGYPLIDEVRRRVMQLAADQARGGPLIQVMRVDPQTAAQGAAIGVLRQLLRVEAAVPGVARRALASGVLAG